MTHISKPNWIEPWDRWNALQSFNLLQFYPVTVRIMNAVKWLLPLHFVITHAEIAPWTVPHFCRNAYVNAVVNYVSELLWKRVQKFKLCKKQTAVANMT